MHNCFVLKIDNKGRIHVSILLMFISLIILMLYMNFEKRIIVGLRDRIDNAIVIGAFSGCICDTERFSGNISVKKYISEGQIEYDFESMFHDVGVQIIHEEAYNVIKSVLLENLQRNNVGNELVKSAYIESLIIYNLTDVLEIHKYMFDDYSYEIVRDYSDEKKVVTPNGIEVEKTCIYVKIRFELSGILIKEKELSLEKCIFLEYY